MADKENKRYTVERALVPKAEGAYVCYLILDNGIPAVQINKAIMLKDKEYPRAPTTDRYHLCKFLNYLDKMGVEFQNVTMEQIYTFLQRMYNYEDASYNTVRKYINEIGVLYERLALNNVPLDESLRIPWPGTEPQVVKNPRLSPQTKIWYLKAMFKPKKADAWMRYTKWYTTEQYMAIADALPLVYRIVFLTTVYLGYRCDSAISVKLSDVNLRTKQIKPSHTKTGQMHVSILPDVLVDLIQAYIANERSQNPGCDSEWLFLSNHGKQVTYHGYYSALMRAAEKVRRERPELDLGPVHTHAGRSTFAAALRTFQLRERRLGHETFSDEDFCTLLDWKSLDNLKYYDKATRIQETAEIHEALHDSFDNVLGDAVDEIIRTNVTNKQMAVNAPCAKSN